MSTSRHAAITNENSRAVEDARHQRNLRKMRRANKDEIIQAKDENQRAVKSVKRDYYLQLTGLKSRQGVKVKKIQGQIKKAVKFEKDRAKDTVVELRKTHKDQIKRLRQNQEAQLQTIRAEHQIQLDNAIRKYNLERQKFDPATASEERER